MTASTIPTATPFSNTPSSLPAAAADLDAARATHDAPDAHSLQHAYYQGLHESLRALCKPCPVSRSKLVVKTAHAMHKGYDRYERTRSGDLDSVQSAMTRATSSGVLRLPPKRVDSAPSSLHTLARSASSGNLAGMTHVASFASVNQALPRQPSRPDLQTVPDVHSDSDDASAGSSDSDSDNNARPVRRSQHQRQAARHHGYHPYEKSPPRHRGQAPHAALVGPRDSATLTCPQTPARYSVQVSRTLAAAPAAPTLAQLHVTDAQATSYLEMSATHPPPHIELAPGARVAVQNASTSFVLVRLDAPALP